MSKLTHKIATAAFAISALAGNLALTSTASVTTTMALSAITSTSVEAAALCRDIPVDTRSDRTSAVFKYQPRTRKGLVRCKNDGGVKRLAMLLPPIPRGAKPSFDNVRRGKTHGGRPDGCSGGGKRGKKLFHAACVAHDICYQTPGARKRQCEVLFRKNMLAISKHGPVGSRVKALSFVAATSAGVRAHKSYRAGQQRFMELLATGNY